MKFADKIRLAWHNIIINKSRSLLTTVIVFVLGFLIMGLMFIGATFSENMNAVYVQLVKENNVTIIHNNQEEKIESIEKLYELLERYDDVVANTSTYWGGVEPFDFSHFKERGIEITKGKHPSNFVGQNVVYLTSDLEELYEIDSIYPTYDANYVVAGFYRSDYHYSPIVDMLYYHNNVLQLERFSIRYQYNENRDFYQDIKKLNKLVDEIKTNFGSSRNIETYSKDLKMLNNIQTISTVLIGVIGFIAMILVLLSIGSVSNSIMISVDQNQRYMGLLKTLGMKNKDVKDLVVIETFLTVVFGIATSSIALVAFQPLIEKLILFLLEFMLRYDYYSVFDTFPFKVVFSVTIPVITTVVFTLMTIWFSRSSIAHMAKSNPIEILNEVN